MKNEEIQFILNILQEKDVKVSIDLDFYAILGFLELNKISGYFYNTTRKLGVKLPQNVERKLSQILKIQTLRNEIMRKYIQDLSDKLALTKLRYVFLKGSVLGNANLNLSELMFVHCTGSPQTLLQYSLDKLDTFYKAGERISNDIDILVEPKDITQVGSLLKEMGFIQGYYNFNEDKIVPLSRQEILSRRMNRGETAPFILKIDSNIVPFIELDINFSLDYLPNGNEKMLDKILSDTVDYSGLVKGGIKSLDCGDFFLHLIMHQYKESVLYSMVERNKDLEMYKLLDIYLFIKRGYIDLNDLLNKIKKYELKKEVHYVLTTVSEVFNDLQISDFLETIKPQDVLYINEVIDPQTKKIYMWQNAVKDRLTEFDKLKFLMAANND